MVRISPEERFCSVALAATKVFGRKGYRGTRMADVAAEAGMSSGLIFSYVESKEALLYSVFAFGFGLFADGLPSLPLVTPAPGETVELIGEHLRKVPVPRLRAALKEDAPSDVRAELQGVVEERYGMVAGMWPLLAVIERCAVDLPELEAFYFGGVRVRYFAQLSRYLTARADGGYFRPMRDTDVTARVITESIAWFAWKRHEGRDAELYDENTVRETLVEFICGSLLEHA
ncbi:MAG TPA: helix-turn-helix domain-containing protein [Acidimicrobiales bacterium]